MSTSLTATLDNFGYLKAPEHIEHIEINGLKLLTEGQLSKLKQETIKTRTLDLQAHLLGRSAQDSGWPDTAALAKNLSPVANATVKHLTKTLNTMFTLKDMRDYGWPNAEQFSRNLAERLTV